MFVNDLVAITLGYVERVRHHAVGGIEQRADLLLAATLEDMRRGRVLILNL
jgi:hypothetical protein